MKLEDLKYLKLSDLTDEMIKQYRQAVQEAFPPIIHQSPIIKNYWSKVEAYFSPFQLFLFTNDNRLLGFANTIAIHWTDTYEKLPTEGWDWMVKKGIEDHEKCLKPNCLGGLQIIITKEHLGKGYSKLILNGVKKMRENAGLEKLIIPIRPTWKWKLPEMSMSTYAQYKTDDKIYDPWIRTHLKAGAEIVKICESSMKISGDVPFWENLLNDKIKSSGSYLIPGALSKVNINVERNYGEYREANIWIKY